MQLNGLMDQLLFRLLTVNIDDKIAEVTNARRDIIPVEKPNIEQFGALIPEITKFVSIFKDNFTTEQTNAMIYRLNHLEIVEELGNPVKLIGFVSLGCYSDKENKIYLNNYPTSRIPIKAWETLMHELLHMASTKKTQVGLLTGLEIPDLLGLNLNEGYTQYLTEKYFTKGRKYVESTDNKVFLAKGIENIIGKDKMEEYYFDANLGKLILELEQYSSRKDVLKLLYLIDRIDNPLFQRKNLRFIVLEIAKLNERKLKKDLEQGIITQEEYDINHAIKVEEYKNYRMWSEETKVIKDKDSFILQDDDLTSNPYFFTSEDEKRDKNNLKNHLNII